MVFFAVVSVCLNVHVLEEMGIENATKLRDKQEINGKMPYSNQFDFYDGIIWVKIAIVSGDNVKCQRVKNKCSWFEIKVIYMWRSVSLSELSKNENMCVTRVRLMCVNNCRTQCIYLFMLYCWWINSTVNRCAFDIIDRWLVRVSWVER